MLFKEEVRIIDMEYNYYAPRSDDYAARHGRLPLICHFYGGMKPDARMKGAAFERYWHHLAQTSFFPAALDSFVRGQVRHLAGQVGHDILDLRRRIVELEHRHSPSTGMNLRR